VAAFATDPLLLLGSFAIGALSKKLKVVLPFVVVFGIVASIYIANLNETLGAQLRLSTTVMRTVTVIGLALIANAVRIAASGSSSDSSEIQMVDINLNERIRQSEDLIHWLDRFIEGKSVPFNDRAIIAAGCLNLSLEHHKSIVLTTTAEFYGSAFALVRLQFEAYLRGVWLSYCATDQAIEKFKNDKLDVRIGTMISALEKQDAFNVGVLSNIKNDSLSAMNSFTHAGVLSINRYFSATEIGSNFSPEEINGTLDFADTFALMAALGIINVSTGTTEDREALAKQILDRCKELADAD